MDSPDGALAYISFRLIFDRSLCQIIEKKAIDRRRRTETILCTVLKFQFDRTCLERGEASICRSSTQTQCSGQCLWYCNRYRDIARVRSVQLMNSA